MTRRDPLRDEAVHGLATLVLRPRRPRLLLPEFIKTRFISEVEAAGAA